MSLVGEQIIVHVLSAKESNSRHIRFSLSVKMSEFRVMSGLFEPCLAEIFTLVNWYCKLGVKLSPVSI